MFTRVGRRIYGAQRVALFLKVEWKRGAPLDSSVSLSHTHTHINGRLAQKQECVKGGRKRPKNKSLHHFADC